ncbi:beta-ketoacyl synthase N-terminal-like domain-containing protein [Bizionia paragorgiae]|uniref:beta-ketoacyl-[acyl-carrier-protein] synthase family protein n=1 Tax=Bizionia paragorgiae TaxID=283786 RepID=UPI00299EBAA8|nr:beta-ketoacyl synthase N-terminal-like domain-containing protein [Bizionia paragorgiae]MDX1271877.1 beta-ketoacyl synthase N-terminal-like domain-containing protein [Bizionia paragorgiae]
MSKVYLSHHNIVSALGFTAQEVVDNIKNEISGLSLIDDPEVFNTPFYGSIIPTADLTNAFKPLEKAITFTKLEKMMLLSLHRTITASAIPLNEKVGLIISSTKGNIDVLNQTTFPKERAYLGALGSVIKDYFGFKNDAIIISNACVSGLLATAIAKRYIKEGVYNHVFIVSGDTLNPFVLSGFNSFQAMSNKPCKPFDKERSGVNLGEAAASVLVTSTPDKLCPEAVALLGDGSRNDANHISGPSRTGEGLFRSITAAIKEANIPPIDIDFISAHGTATLFNDEMEAIAFNRLGFNTTPTHSLKGYFGHTLGASGLIETLIGMHSLHQNTLFKSLGYSTHGVSKPLNIIEKTTPQKNTIFLKTASGFGGSNTAVLFKKVN